MYHITDNNEIGFPNPRHVEANYPAAVGGDLGADRLLFAYSMGYFPWFNPDEPPLWWCPDPRMVLYPKDLKVAKSMRSAFHKSKFRVTFDTAFREVMEGCRTTKDRGADGENSWITTSFIDAYAQLYNIGLCHSVEVWQGDELVGGLYGISLGKVFFGESMFARVPNASKFGFICLVKLLEQLNFLLIDCQQDTKHLRSLGALPISRDLFLDTLEENPMEETMTGSWEGLGEHITSDIYK
jgi:leucyl/phenylalanyl-tRNA---protein transferase